MLKISESREKCSIIPVDDGFISLLYGASCSSNLNK